jgi:hypothetical protein
MSRRRRRQLELELEEVPTVRPGRPRAPGYAIPPRPEGLERPETLIICEDCGGAGWTSEADPCPACDGDGVLDNPDGPAL